MKQLGRPGGLQGSGLQLSTDMQEVVAEKDAPLQQQEEEADAVPDDTSLLHGQQAVPVSAHHLFGCEAETSMGRGPVPEAVGSLVPAPHPRFSPTHDCSSLLLCTRG